MDIKLSTETLQVSLKKKKKKDFIAWDFPVK